MIEYEGYSYPAFDEDEEECCPRCGKPFEEFGELGCEHCDARVRVLDEEEAPAK